jgi:hypothetical protein
MRGSETWFDRLAAPHTRRQSLKAAALGVAGAAAASLPLAGPVAKAAGANPAACRKGCTWTASQEFVKASQSCGHYFLAESFDGGFLNFISGGPLLVGIGNVVYGNRIRRCLDRARYTFDGELTICEQPNCPGFDPHGEGGPCETCKPPLYCNPCQALESGYICCVYPEGDCHGDCCTVGSGCP